MTNSSNESRIGRARKNFSIDPLAADINTDRSPFFRWLSIGILVVLGLLLETTVFSSWKVFDSSPTFGYVATAAVAYYCGAGNTLYVLFSIMVGFEELFSLHSAYLIVVSSLLNVIASPFIFAITKNFIGAPAWKNR